jgi:formate dehydrogenase subunit gamma
MIGSKIFKLARKWAAALAILIAAGIFISANDHSAYAQTGGLVPGSTVRQNADTDFWREIRKGKMGTVSIPDKQAGVLVQSEGENWRAFRNGPLSVYGGWGLLGILILLALFFLVRGRIKIDSGLAKRTVERFNSIERFSHWLLATSFIILGLTGLNTLYGRYVLIPVIGKDAFAWLSLMGKWLHDYVAWAFMAGLVMILLLWFTKNMPSRTDLVWLAKGGGMFVKGSHPPSKKFNAGQKILFWLVILGGLSVSLTGIALLFPFQIPLFGKTFAFINLFGTSLPTELSMLQEMQLSQAWHAIVALILMIVVIAHIYIGTIGMEGAFDAMGSGQVDVNWAKEHHSIWAEEVVGAGKARTANLDAGSSATRTVSQGKSKKPRGIKAARGGNADDLKVISGVGPKLEKTLNELGFYHYDQIANWTKAEVAWVDDHLNFKGRIDRDGWKNQAKALAAGKKPK